MIDPAADLKLVLAFQHQIRTSLTTLNGYLSLAETDEVKIGPARNGENAYPSTVAGRDFASSPSASTTGR